MTLRAVRLMDEPDWPSLLPRVEEIFFTSSAIQKFADEARRERFKVRWLGRYLEHYLESFFVARNNGDAVVGYLAGCLDDPARNPLFADLGYYRAFGPLCASYPAHLHINVAADVRNLGVGAALIAAFAAQVSQRRLPGLHLVTNEGARNIRFYERNGFRLLATTSWNDAPVVFMGRELAVA